MDPKFNITNNIMDYTFSRKININKDAYDKDFYAKAYKDVRSRDIDPRVHYNTHGKLENRLPNATRFRTLYPDFDQSSYLMYNKDLINFTTEELMAHYHHHGRFEARVCKKSVDKPMQVDKEDSVGKEKASLSKDCDINGNQLKIISLGGSKQESVADSSKANDITIVEKEIDDLSKGLIRAPNAYPTKKYLDEINLKKVTDKDLKEPVYTQLDDKLKEVLITKSKTKPIYLVMADWGYPPFGGGECWLIDTMRWMLEKGYQCYYIYFCDARTGKLFENIQIIDIAEGRFIQFTQNSLELIRFVKLLNPKVISHQGASRSKHMRIANLLEIPFITGFCFWQDIIELRAKPGEICNKDMETKTLIPDPNFPKIHKNSQHLYAVGQFVNDIAKKVHGIDIDVINTISDESHYRIESKENDVYVTVVNICGLKGGLILNQLIKNTSLNIPFLLVDSQNGNEEINKGLEKLLKERNLTEKVHKSVYIKGSIVDIKPIYRKTRILLTPSLVDETFCRVGYEGMMNGIPILSTKTGNLKHLLSGYADYIDPDPLQWAQKINKIYDDENYLNEMKSRPKSINLGYDKNKFVAVVEKFSQINKSIYLDSKNIGIFCPWGDQGLGIQCREYYDVLIKLGYGVSIFSFKPYHATVKDPRLQTDPKEWNYENIHYSENTRESVTNVEFIEYIHEYKIKKMIFVETCYDKIFELAKICKMLSINTYAIPNIETLRYPELYKHKLFDRIICNNQMTYELINYIYPQKTELLGFRILNKQFYNEKNWNKNHNSFFCVGGLNALTRKNIHKIISAYKSLESQKKLRNFKLYVYIQGVEIPPDINRYASREVIIKVGSRTYAEIAKLYREHDIFIHMGDHEGLGLGFYESLASGTPVFTIDTPPNNEIIHEGQNGWLVKCDYDKLTDNNEAISKKAIIHVGSLKEKFMHIINNYNRKQIQESTWTDYQSRYPVSAYLDDLRKIIEI